METITSLSEWKQKTVNQIHSLDAKDSFYLTVPKEKIGMLGGFNIAGYIAKYTSSFGRKEVTYSAAKELRSYCQSWQWHVCYASNINKRLKKDEMKYKIHSFKNLDAAINFVIS